MGSASTTARSRLGGVPTTLPPATAGAGFGPDRQLALPIAAPPRPSWLEVMPSVVHVPGWLDVDGQRELVADFRRWAMPPAGLRHPRMPTGHLMTVQSVCLGWYWSPYAYSRPRTTPMAHR